MFDFKQDDKQSPIYFQRSYARTNDVSVLTSNRLSNRFEIKDNKYTDRQIMTDEEIQAYKEHLERLKKNDKN